MKTERDLTGSGEGQPMRADDKMSMLVASSLGRSFGGYVALDQVDLEVDEGEFVALLGPSGCGKTTLLKLIAGLIEPTTGALHIAGQDMVRISAHRRPVNTVFQNYALFLHLPVFDNVAFGPRRRRRPEVEIAADVHAALKLVGMESFVSRYPAQLSGGQQQRIALARAIINKPSVLLLDEPLAALDLQLRKHMQLELKALQRKLGMTFIFVTHDQDEALTMADKIVVMNRGRIEQIGSGEDIYNRPATRFVAGFIGEANFLDISDEPIESGALTSGTGQLMVRPEHITISSVLPSAPNVQFVQGEVREVIFKGATLSCLCATARGSEIVAVTNVGRDDLWPGEHVYLSWEAGAARLFDN